MRVLSSRSVLGLILAASILSCSENPTRPKSAPDPLRPQAGTANLPPPQVVISQVYGGGGNSGATLKNDFIELFNPGGQPVSLAGWSVQYASSAGTVSSVTALTGTIPAGGYHLVREAAGTGGTVNLPTPDDTGSIAMASGSGKVWLASTLTKLAGTCPTGAGVVDGVAYGTSANCPPTTRTLANATAAIRNDAGCAYTGNDSTDFSVAAPAPRNSASPVHVCPGQIPVGPLDHVAAPDSVTVAVGGTVQLVALPQDTLNQFVATARVAWSSSDPQIATVDTAGTVTGVAVSATRVTITATATDTSGITKSAAILVTVYQPGIHWIDVSSSSSSFPPGFQTQLFATAREANGGVIIPAIFTFEAVNPDIATIAYVNNTGLVTGVAPGTPTFRITATPTNGGTPYTFTTTVKTPPVVIEAAVWAGNVYGANDGFGRPSPAAGGDPTDFPIVRPQYTISYNQTHGTPNWVAYELDTRQLGTEDRCNCFSADTALPLSARIFTSDYTNGGFDRGHMARSADRTAANGDNATTFYLTNIVPQYASLNQGAWAKFENLLGDSARAGRAVYIITGPLYSRSHGLTYLKNEGKVAIPDSTWKVAIIGPANGGKPFTPGDVASWDDLAGVTVLAVNMPNVTSVDSAWRSYATTVDRIEAATGYDLLALLSSTFQAAVEAGDHAPRPGFVVTGPLQEGTDITFDAASTTDPDLGRTDLDRTEALTYAWLFSDGDSAKGPKVTHRFADDGGYSAKLIVTDAFGWEQSTKQSISVANVAPTVTFGATSLTIVSGDSVSGSFADPGADAPWHALMDWGGGHTAASTWSAAGLPIAAATSYLAPGSYTLTLTVTDQDGAAGSASVAVTIARRQVAGEANPTSIDAAQTDGDIMVTLHSAAGADVSTLDPASVNIAGTGLSAGKKIKVKDRGGDGTSIVLRFARADLIDAGLLTPATTELVVTGALAGGVQIVAHVPVSVH